MSATIRPAEVTGIDPDTRLIQIKWYGSGGDAKNVRVVSDTGDFSMPRVGDIGLVIQDEAHSFYLGKIEYAYGKKVEGREKDADTDATILAKRVLEGEIYIGNLIKRTWLSLSSAGDFALLNGFSEGLRYYFRNRILRLAGMVTRVVGNGVTFKLGSVMRDIPTSDTIVAEVPPIIPAIEAYLELVFNAVKLARFHLGHIKNSAGIDELSTLGGRLRAILEVAVGPVTMAALKMDEQGNIEVTSLAGKIMIDTTAIQSIWLGGVSAVHRALCGEPFLAHYKAHTHPTAMGPSGTPIPVLVDESVLSQKVKLF